MIYDVPSIVTLRRRNFKLTYNLLFNRVPNEILMYLSKPRAYSHAMGGWY